MIQSLRLLRLLALLTLLGASVAPALADGVETLLDLGEYHMRRGDFASALSYFEKAMKTDPGNVYAHVGYQVSSRETGKDVFPEYERRYLANPTHPDSAYLYARLLVPEKAIAALKGVEQPNFHVHFARAKAFDELGRSEAKTEIQYAAQKCPEEPRAVCQLAAYFEKTDDLVRAKQWFERAVKLAPKRVEALVGLGNTLRLQGELDPALAELRKAQEIDKEDPEVHYRVGLTYHDMKSYQLARKAYDDALARAKDDVDVLLAYGDTWIQEGKPDEAEKRFRKAVELAPRRIDALRRLGYSLELQGGDEPVKNDEALECFEEIAKLDPLDTHCHIAIGWIFAKKGKFNQALKKFRQASDLDPKEVACHFFLGYTYDLMGKWTEAAECYTRAIRIDPEYARAYNNLGLDLDLLGKSSKAIKNFRKAVDLEPENPEYLLNLGNAYFNAGKYKEAVSVFTDLVDLHPELVHGWTGLGRSYRQLRKYRESVDAYLKAIELTPDQADLHLIVGIIYEKNLKDLEKALHHYEQYIILGGEDPVVQDWIDALKKKVK